MIRGRTSLHSWSLPAEVILQFWQQTLLRYHMPFMPSSRSRSPLVAMSTRMRKGRQRHEVGRSRRLICWTYLSATLDESGRLEMEGDDKVGLKERGAMSRAPRNFSTSIHMNQPTPRGRQSTSIPASTLHLVLLTIICHSFEGI